MASTLYYSKAPRTLSFAIRGDKVVSPDGLHSLLLQGSKDSLFCHPGRQSGLARWPPLSTTPRLQGLSLLPSGETKWSRPMASTLYYSKAPRTHSFAIRGDKVV